jgi:type I restriction enzyme S subunit
VKPLKEVCQYQRGLTYTKSDEVEYSSNIVLRANNIDLGTHSLNLSDLKYISDDVTVSQTKRVRPGSLLICTASGSKSHLGKVAFIDQDYGYAFGGFMGQITPKKEVKERFLFYVLTSSTYKRYIDELSDGVNINNLKYDQLGQFPVIVPPLPEQRRIVAILDEAFEGIATAKANAEKNLQNAREVFESHMNAVFSQRGEGWFNETLSQLAKFIDYRGKTPNKTECGLRLITAKNVKMGYLQLTPMEFVAPESYESWMTRGIPRIGDVLFTTEAPLANVAQLDTDERVVFAQRIIILQPDCKKLSSSFLKYSLLSLPVQKHIHEVGTGATVKGIKARLLKQIEIAFPSLHEQHTIVTTLDFLREETQHLESIYQQKLTTLDELKQSLLHQAFNGDL